MGYITPKDMLAGHQQEIQADRDRKLEASSEKAPPPGPVTDETDYFRLADQPSTIRPSTSKALLRQLTKSGISDGRFSANLRINRPGGFLPYFFKPAFQFVIIVSGGTAPEPFTCCPFPRS